MSSRVILATKDGIVTIIGIYEDPLAGNKKFDLLIKKNLDKGNSEWISTVNRGMAKYDRSYIQSECIEEWFNAESNTKLSLYRSFYTSSSATYDFMRDDY